MTGPQAETTTRQGPPAGFRTVQADEPTGTRVDKEALKTGVIVEFRGTRRFPRRGKEGTTVVHIFVNRGGKGERFSVFGTAQLDSKLSRVVVGSILWLMYGGKKDVDGQDTHVWHVSDAGKRLDETQLTRMLSESERAHTALDAAIETAKREAELRREKAGNSAAPSGGDFDREFLDDEIPY